MLALSFSFSISSSLVLPLKRVFKRCGWSCLVLFRLYEFLCAQLSGGPSYDRNFNALLSVSEDKVDKEGEEEKKQAHQVIRVKMGPTHTARTGHESIDNSKSSKKRRKKNKKIKKQTNNFCRTKGIRAWYLDL